VEERDPRFLIDGGLLEKLDDFEHGGRTVPASRLGYRITASFADRFLGRIFETPDTIFTDEILRPEKQDLEAFVAGVEAIAEAQKRVALLYFEDGSIAGACPPLRALLNIMAYGAWEGKGADHLEVRAMFTREALLASDWYAERLRVKQERDIALWRRHVASLESFRSAAGSDQIDLEARLAVAREQLARVSADAYREELVGTIGADPFTGQW
jgi:hypothetical protein